MHEIVEAIQPMAEVTLPGDIDAIVTQVCIGPKLHVTYQVAWWEKSNRQTAWVERSEVTLKKEVPRVQIGFRT